MKQTTIAGVILALVGCNNFDALVERCTAEGRCGASGSGGGVAANAEPPALVVSPATLSFSMVAGEQPMVRRVTLSNIDGGIASSLAINLGGVNQADFSIANACSTALSPGQSCPVDVTFRPADQSVSARTAALELRALGAPVVLVPLEGRITAPLEFPASTDFGDVTVGTSRELSVVIRNLSTSPVMVLPTTGAPFAVTSNGCASVAGSQSCLVNVRVDANQPGSQIGQLLLGLSGTSLGFPVPLLVRGVTPGVLTLEPAQLYPPGSDNEFVGQQSDRVFTVRNNGTQTLGPITLSLSHDAGFELLDAGCGLLDAGATCSGVLRFAPTTFDAFGFVLVADGGPAGSAQQTGVAFARQSFLITTNVLPPNTGATVTVNGNACFNQCTTQSVVDVRTIPMATAVSRRSEAFDLGTWGADCQGAASTPCGLRQNRDLTVTSTFDRVPIAFATSQLFNGALGGLAGADAICDRVAADAGLPGSYRAFLGTSDAGVLQQFRVGTGFIRPDGVPLFSILEPTQAPVTNERGSFVFANGSTELRQRPWSGLTTDAGTTWQSSTATCANWTATNSSGLYGRKTAEWWASDDSDFCSNTRPLFCLGTTTGQPLPMQQRVRLDAGVMLFVVNGSITDGGTNANGLTREGLQESCTNATVALGLPASNAYAYVGFSSGVASEAFSPPGLDAGLAAPLVTLDGKVLALNANVLRGDWAPLRPIQFAVFPDGGIGVAGMPINTTTSTSNYGPFRRQAGPSGGTTCSQYQGDALSTTEWWGPAASTSRPCSAASYWVYCVAFP